MGAAPDTTNRRRRAGSDRGGESLEWQGRTDGCVSLRRSLVKRCGDDGAVRNVHRPAPTRAADVFSNRVVEAEQMSYDQLLTCGELRATSNSCARRLRRGAVCHGAAAKLSVRHHHHDADRCPVCDEHGAARRLYGIGIGLTLAIAYWVTTSVFGAWQDRRLTRNWPRGRRISSSARSTWCSRSAPDRQTHRTRSSHHRSTDAPSYPAACAFVHHPHDFSHVEAPVGCRVRR